MLKKFVLGGMVVVAALLGNACGDDGSSDSPAGPADSMVTLSSSSDDVVLGNSSSSSVTESPSTSSGQAPQSAESDGSSSSEKAVDGSSSSDGKASSSSGKVESSSGKGEKSSSSEGAAGSSSAKAEDSSSSAKVDESSSSMKAAESSSSVKVEESSSSEKNEVSSSSEKPVESSSSEKVEESSSSEMPSLSSEYSSSSVSSSSALNSIYDAENNTLTDLRDNHVYKTVTIGTQVWMAQNIDYLPEDTVGTKYGGNSVCGGGETGTFNEGDCSVYGRLYFRKVLIDSVGDGRGVCPDGWIIPTLTHWNVLIDYLGGSFVAGKKMKLDDNSMWGETMEHSNESGFSATLTGYYTTFGGFNDVTDSNNRTSMLVYPIDKSGYSDEMKTKTIYDVEDKIRDHVYHGPQYAISVRCIKN